MKISKHFQNMARSLCQHVVRFLGASFNYILCETETEKIGFFRFIIFHSYFHETHSRALADDGSLRFLPLPSRLSTASVKYIKC